MKVKIRLSLNLWIHVISFQVSEATIDKVDENILTEKLIETLHDLYELNLIL